VNQYQALPPHFYFLSGQGESLRTRLCHHYETVELENVPVSMAMINPEKANDTCLGFNTFHMTKCSYISVSHMQSVGTR